MKRTLLLLFLLQSIFTFGKVQLDPAISAGQLDPDFNPTVVLNHRVIALSEQEDGKILIGILSLDDGVGLFRLNSDGSTDLDFLGGTSFFGSAREIIVQPDQKIIVVGDSPSYVVRLNTDGSLDPTFNFNGLNTNPLFWVNDAQLQEDGKIVIGGNFDLIDGIPMNGFARLNSDGSLDTTFNANMPPVSYIRTLDIQDDGKIIAAGQNDEGNQFKTFRRYNTDGSLDTSFDGDESEYIYDIEVDRDGKIMIGGIFHTYKDVINYGVARINSDGSLDPTFVSYNLPQNGIWYTMFDIIIMGDGKYLLGGTFLTYDGLSRKHIAKVNNDGTLDTSFVMGSGPNGLVWEIFMQRNGDILVGGNFTTFSGEPMIRIARLSGSAVLSVDDESLVNSFDMFPNPISDKLNFKITDPSISGAEISIYTLTGQLIASDEITDQKEMNLDFLAKGIYLAKVQVDEKTFTKKIIKN